MNQTKALLLSRTLILSKALLLPITLTLLSLPSLGNNAPQLSKCPEAFDINIRKLHSKEMLNLCDLYQENKPVLVVNTASHCGFTPQFKELEALHQKYKKEGLVVLGFPSNSFNQEESSEKGTAGICYKNYGVSFTMLEHVEVKGKNAHPLFKFLATQSQAPLWNFNKYIVQQGKVTHFGSSTKPLNSTLEKALKF